MLAAAPFSFSFPLRERAALQIQTFCSTTSALYIYSKLSEKLNIISVVEKRGLCVAGLPLGGRSGWGRPFTIAEKNNSDNPL